MATKSIKPANQLADRLKEAGVTFKKINKEFIIVFVPKIREDYQGRRRFGIGAGQIGKYIGDDNAFNCLCEMVNSREQVEIFKYRTRGAVVFYSR